VLEIPSIAIISNKIGEKIEEIKNSSWSFYEDVQIKS